MLYRCKFGGVYQEKSMSVLNYFDSNIKVYGPYFNKKQKRNYATYIDSSGKKTQKTYAKYLMEQHLGRHLSRDEEVDHIDRNKMNDVISNLQILSREEHNKIDAKRVKNIEVQCAWKGCAIMLVKTPRQMRIHNKRGHAGPFCGAVCRGKYGKMVQETKEKLPIQKSYDNEYFYLDKK